VCYIKFENLYNDLILFKYFYTEYKVDMSDNTLPQYNDIVPQPQTSTGTNVRTRSDMFRLITTDLVFHKRAQLSCAILSPIFAIITLIIYLYPFTWGTNEVNTSYGLYKTITAGWYITFIIFGIMAVSVIIHISIVIPLVTCCNVPPNAETISYSIYCDKFLCGKMPIDQILINLGIQVFSLILVIMSHIVGYIVFKYIMKLEPAVFGITNAVIGFMTIFVLSIPIGIFCLMINPWLRACKIIRETNKEQVAVNV
jgi:hypothetical protein